ncbi:CHY zinc finger protein [Halalkalicoccus subterraneus]|uniref:CHY zinc finger protein n=1 Tax=Halalkalicoccus subterraneus TaxID=2675002 RepID=UPI000EFD87BF|nr:CHY zinc finger protein [Halalkalicoccus subterraneus]
MVTPAPVRGVDLDRETRCTHYDSPRDVIAIRFFCCGEYYACYECHAARSDHDAERWPEDARQKRAVLCGVCDTELTIAEYLDCDDACPACGAAFNPGCANHHHLYFAGVSEASGPGRP